MGEPVAISEATLERLKTDDFTDVAVSLGASDDELSAGLFVYGFETLKRKRTHLSTATIMQQREVVKEKHSGRVHQTTIAMGVLGFRVRAADAIGRGLVAAEFEEWGET